MMQKSPRVLLTYCNAGKEGFQRDFVVVHELKRASKLKMSSNRPRPFGVDAAATGDQDYNNHSSDNIDKTRYSQITSGRTTRNNYASLGMKPIHLTRQRSNVFELIKETKRGFLILLFCSLILYENSILLFAAFFSLLQQFLPFFLWMANSSCQFGIAIGNQQCSICK